MTTMTEERATDFIENELMPIVRIDNPSNISVLFEDLEALKIALTSENSTLVFAMASYIATLRGVNGQEIAQRIADEILK